MSREMFRRIARMCAVAVIASLAASPEAWAARKFVWRCDLEDGVVASSQTGGLPKYDDLELTVDVNGPWGHDPNGTLRRFNYHGRNMLATITQMGCNAYGRTSQWSTRPDAFQYSERAKDEDDGPGLPGEPYSMTEDGRIIHSTFWLMIFKDKPPEDQTQCPAIELHDQVVIGIDHDSPIAPPPPGEHYWVPYPEIVSVKNVVLKYVGDKTVEIGHGATCRYVECRDRSFSGEDPIDEDCYPF